MNVPTPKPSRTADRQRLLALVRALNDDDLITLAVFLDLSMAAATGEPDSPDHPPAGTVHVGPSPVLVLALAAAELARRLTVGGVAARRPATGGGCVRPAVARARRGRASRFPRGRGCRR